jgi:hypothetical protein
MGATASLCVSPSFLPGPRHALVVVLNSSKTINCNGYLTSIMSQPEISQFRDVNRENN